VYQNQAGTARSVVAAFTVWTLLSRSSTISLRRPSVSTSRSTQPVVGWIGFNDTVLGRVRWLRQMRTLLFLPRSSCWWTNYPWLKSATQTRYGLRLGPYRVGQKSKLYISEFVSKTEKLGGMWTNANIYRENGALRDIFTRNIYSQLFYVQVCSDWKQSTKLLLDKHKLGYVNTTSKKLCRIEYLTTQIELVLPSFKSCTVHKIIEYLTLGLLSSFWNIYHSTTAYFFDPPCTCVGSGQVGLGRSFGHLLWIGLGWVGFNDAVMGWVRQLPEMRTTRKTLHFIPRTINW